ncbi:MAG TPA: FCD domain-containing protein [Dermatophilaceae bacterium]|nr:FCD domain-containing protein [Dermatophilaceae bacterium]
MSRPRLYEQLVERVMDYVSEEKLSEGQRLPTERDLARHFGVSRASVAQAVVALEVQGILRVRQGDGIYLLHPADPAETVRELIRRRQRLPDILEAREAIEVKITFLAAQRRSDEDLVAIDSALDMMAADVAAGEHGFAGDRAFHAAVTAAARNPILAGLMDQLAEPIEETRRESLSQPGRPPVSLVSHRGIANALRDSDPAGAARAARRHITLVADVALLTWENEGRA